MSELDTNFAVDILPTIRSADISAVMAEIGTRIGIQVKGEVRDLAGALNPDAAYAIRAVENARGLATDGNWGYYAKQVVGKPDQFLKAWVRWRVQEAIYDCYLAADALTIFNHATPYAGTLY